MFDIGWSELVVVGIVALVVIGPKELPGVLRTLGQWMTKIRRMASEFQGQFQEAMREAEMADLKKQVEQLGESTSLTNFDPIETARREMESAFEDKPASANDTGATTPEPVVVEGDAPLDRAAALSSAPEATLPAQAETVAAPADAPSTSEAERPKVPEPEGGGRAA
jgi:sec-independent protein translocase protein TatB